LRHQSTPVHISKPNTRIPAELDTKSVASSDQEVDDLEYALQLSLSEQQHPDYLRHQSTPVHISKPNTRIPAELDTKSVASSDQEVDDLEYAQQLSLAEHQRSERLRHQSTLGHIPRENATKPQKQPQQDTNHIVIAVCGMTGTGKSTFISKIAQKQVAIGHGLQSSERS
jgi:flagellar biosynthesis GTPase FlhF